MAAKKTSIKSAKALAKLAEKAAPCAFCKRDFLDEESTFGKLYSIGDIHCHYFCALLSCCLIQKGKDDEGLFGFMYPDILAEIERSKKHKCSYCGTEGATLGCSISQCKKQFHLPCGREKHAVSLYYGNYKSFCEKHAPKQKITPAIMDIAKARLSRTRKLNRDKCLQTINNDGKGSDSDDSESVCVICYEAVDGFPTARTFWPPCCARDAWFHRSCLQRMALSAGLHYLKCPLCNDKDTFANAVLSQGYYLPDRDAAWELEQNAFSDMYERPVSCRAHECRCARGRDYDANCGMWDIKLCVLCGSPGVHAACSTAELYVCAVCAPAAPDDAHLAAIDAVSLPSQNQSQQTLSGPVMPSRMSIRRTKPRHVLYTPSPRSLRKNRVNNDSDNNTAKTNTIISREELNLKPPKRPAITQPPDPKPPENELLSPVKLLRQGLIEKLSAAEVDKIIFETTLLDDLRRTFKKPKPLSVKRKIVSDILDQVLNYAENEPNMEVQCSTDNVKEPIQDIKTKDLENISIYTEKTCNFQNKDIPCTENLELSIPIQNQKDIENASKELEHISINNQKEITLENSRKEFLCENANLTPKKSNISDDDSTSSPFQLPPEFIADSSNSLPSLPIIETPKKLKKVNIENDSMEIFENNQVVNIDLVKIENGGVIKLPETKCLFKLSPLNKDILEKNVDIDVESFKNQYLSEVDRKMNCKFEHNHNNVEKSETKFKTAIDFAMEASKTAPKRKLPHRADVASKKRKTTKTVRKLKCQYNFRAVDKGDTKNYAGKSSSNDKTIKRRLMKRRKYNDNAENSEDNSKKRELKRKHTEVSIRNRNINLKIRFQSDKLDLQISKPKKKARKVKESPKVLKQYILQYPADHKPLSDCIVRPDGDVTPIRRKYCKSEISSDTLKQTSIVNFFKVSPKN